MRKTTLFAILMATFAFVSAQEDYTHYLVNPDLEQGLDETVQGQPTGVRNTLYPPVGWSLTADAADWDTYSINGTPVGASDAFATPLLFPSSGAGYYQHSISNGGTFVTVQQTCATLPSGRYKLTFDAAWINRSANEGQYFVFVASVGRETKYDIPAGQNWTSGEIEFAIADDEDPITFGFTAKHNSWGELQTYADNFKLFRTGDVTVEDLINAFAAEIAPLQAVLQAKFEEVGFDLMPNGWESLIYAYIDPWGPEITTMAQATAFRDKVLEWTTTLDNLLAAREELAALKDDCDQLLTLEYDGLVAFTEEVGKVNALMATNSTTEQLQNAIPALVAAMQDYIFSGLNTATYENPIEITFKVVNPTVEGTIGNQNLECAPGWTLTVSGTTQPYLYGGDRYTPDAEGGSTLDPGPYFNTWNGTLGAAKYTSAQTITGLPNGIYKVGANLAGDGMGIYVYGLSGGIYTGAEVKTNSGQTWQYIEAENIVVLDGTLTIGHTGVADELWGGNRHSASYYSGDDFRLFYCGNDMSAVAGVLAAAITNAETLIAGDGSEYLLKGDKANIDAIIVAAQAALNLGEPEAMTVALGQVATVSGIFTASTDAYFVVADAIAEAEAIAVNSDVTAATKTAINGEAVIVNAWLGSEDATSADAANVVAALAALVAQANEEIIAADYARQYETLKDATRANPVDATFLIVNPTVNGTTNVQSATAAPGWTIEVTGSTQPYLHTNGSDYGSELGGGSNTTTYFNTWNGTIGAAKYYAWQLLENIPNGYYTLTAKLSGDMPAASAEASLTSGAYLFARSHGYYYTTETTPDTYFHVYTIDEIVVKNNRLIIGVTTKGDELFGGSAFAGTWFSADDFTLTFLEHGWNVGVTEVETAPALKAYAVDGYIKVEGATTYTITSISGATVAADSKLVPGIYIVSAAGKSVKVAVK